MRHLLCILSVLVLIGCSDPDGPVGKNTARINDVAVPISLDTGYKVVEVDGKLAVRARSAFMTVVPFVIVPVGQHTLSVKPKQGPGDAKAFVVTVVAGKTYRIADTANGNLSLVEDSR